MKLKRIYDHSGGEPRASHLVVYSTPEVQKFSTGVVERLVEDGLMTLGGGKIILKTAEGEEDVVYRIVAGPGHYCCHCNARLGGEQEGRTHVEQEHEGEESPDPNNPAGYRRDHGYTAVLDGSDLDAGGAEKAAQGERRKANTRHRSRRKPSDA